MVHSRLIKPLLDEDYPIISHGQGIYLYDTEGKKYLDGSSGAVTASLGHGVKEIVEAINEQARKVSFVYRSQFTSLPAEQLANKLSSISEGISYWSFLVNSGSEATETALKIAIQYWQELGITTKNKIISRKMSYHGITIGALSMSGHYHRRVRFSSLLEDYPTVPPPYCYRCPFDDTYPNCKLKCATELERVIETIGEKYIAAFIIEPIVGAAGAAITPPDGYYKEIRRICDKYNILLISDEVMTGIGRTGKMLALEHWDIVADIVCLGKGLSAGYTPIAAVLSQDKIIAPIQRGSKIIMSGHTFSGNPQSANVALAVLKYIEDNQLIHKAEKNGYFLLSELTKLKDKHSIIGDIRGKGLLLGLEFVSVLPKHPFETKWGVANLVISIAKQHGLLVYPASAGDNGIQGDAIIIAPPLTITKREIKELILKLDQSLEVVCSELRIKGVL